MKTVFLNPFLPTDLNEKVTSVSFKIGSVIYRAYNMTEVSYQSTQGNTVWSF